MFDVAPSEMLVIAIVAIVFIGPKDLPRVLRVVGQWVARGRGLARQFRGAIDDMVREAELAEMEQKWREENERIMREHADLIGAPPPAAALPRPDPAPALRSGEIEATSEPHVAEADRRDAAPVSPPSPVAARQDRANG